MSSPPAWIANYQALTQAGVGFCDLGHRTRIEVRGEDRARVLHNLCTNDILSLSVGRGREAFVTFVQGKIQGHVDIWQLPDCCYLESVPGQASQLIAHIEKYVIREDVTLSDRSKDGRVFWIAGPAAADLLPVLCEDPFSPAGSAAEDLTVGVHVWRGVTLIVRRLEWTRGGGWAVEVPVAEADAFQRELLTQGAVACPPEAWDAARVEQGTPFFGRDIGPDNLPQEVGRNERAISFTKGCYLGQETVARIDALGHVNQQLRGLLFTGWAAAEGCPPELEQVLQLGDRPVATPTSVVWSPKLGHGLALAYVRRGHDEPGTELKLPQGTVQVLSLPC